jgi:hypothetical protein
VFRFLHRLLRGLVPGRRQAPTVCPPRLESLEDRLAPTSLSLNAVNPQPLPPAAESLPTVNPQPLPPGPSVLLRP